MSAPESETCSVSQARRPSPVLYLGCSGSSFVASRADTCSDQRENGDKQMNDVMERSATSYAVIDAVDNKASDCRGMLKSLVDATNGITGPQAGLLGCLVVSIAGWRDMEYTPFATWLNPTPPSSSPLEGCALRRIRQCSARRAASNRRTGESMQMNEMPSIGTTLTYGEAIKASTASSGRDARRRAYGAELLPAVGL